MYEKLHRNRFYSCSIKRICLKVRIRLNCYLKSCILENTNHSSEKLKWNFIFTVGYYFSSLEH
jgi:hypothetical protein